MPARSLTRAAIVLVAAGALAFTSLYGPSRRVHAAPPRVVPVASAAEAGAIWRQLGLRGRVGIVLSPDLVPARFGLGEAESAALAPGIEAVGEAMSQGILREVRHVVPAARWPGLSRSLAHVTIYWAAADGFVGAFEDGRVSVLPASRLGRNQEAALVLVDAAAWSEGELGEIARRIRRGDLRTDLVAVLNGTPAQVALLDAALALR